MIKLIIFDFDGVIIDNYELHYELMEKKISNLTREEHRKMFEGNIHVEMKKLKHRETEFDFKTPFCETKIKTKIKKEIQEDNEIVDIILVTSNMIEKEMNKIINEIEVLPENKDNVVKLRIEQLNN